MANLETKFQSVKQDWETPSTLFDPLHKEFSFTLDAAASAQNAKVPTYFTSDDDGIRKPWGTNIVWINPPYGIGKSPLSAWVIKAYRESMSGATSVMLIPARTNTNWFHDYCLKYAEVRFLRGRPVFVGAKHGLPQPLCLVIFRPPNRRDELL